MKKQLKSIRKRLNSNKIFFEIAASLSVIFIAIQANTISKAQVENSELINQPDFTIRKLDNDNIIIDSDTFRFSNLSLATSSKLNFTYTIKNLDSNSYAIRIPNDLIIFDNFRWIQNPNLSSEIELGLVGEKDSLFLASKNSMKNYLEKKYKKDVEIGDYFIQTFLELSYLDYKGNVKVLYFDITENPHRVFERPAKRVFNEEFKTIYLDLMGYEDLENIFYPKTYYDEDGRRMYFIDGLEYYYDEDGRKIKLTDSTG